MKKIIAMLLSAAMLFTLFAGCSSSSSSSNDSDSDSNSSSSDEVYELKIDYPNAENSAIYPVLVEWADWLYEQSDGRIQATIYSGGALGNISDCVNNVEAGVTDGCWSAMNLYTGIWPLCDIFALPMLGADSFEVMQAAIEETMEQEVYQEQFDNVHLVAIHTSTPASFIFADEVDSMQDVAGKTVRAFSNYCTPWLEDLGAIPVSVSSNDGYESISKGVVDGGLWYLDQIQSSALYEIIKTVFYGEMCYPVLFLCLNNDVYESMPEDLQEIIDNSSEYYLSLIYDAYYEQEETVLALLEEYDVTVIYTSDEDLEWMRGYADSAYELFIENVAEYGYDGQEYIDDLQATIERIESELE